MTAAGAPQIPILCVRCGGPVEPREDLSFVCPFCGTADRLPASELDRALALKARIGAAARRRAQLTSTEVGLARIFESRAALLRVAAPWWIGALVLIGVMAIVRGEAPPVVLVLLVCGPLFLIGLSLVLAVVVGRAGYARSVRPHLFARAPLEPGRPCRCRVCSGDLPDERGPVILCRWCGTPSLVTPLIHANRARLLHEEQQSYFAVAQSAIEQSARIGVSMTRTFLVALLVIFAGGAGVLVAVAVALHG